MRGGSVDEPRPRRQSHVVGSQNWTIGPAILFKVWRKRVAVTQSGEGRPRDAAQDARRRAENRLEIGAEMDSLDSASANLNLSLKGDLWGMINETGKKPRR